MSFNALQWGLAIAIMTTHCVVGATQTVSDKNELVVFLAQPAKCIALHQGRQCFTTVTLSFKLSQVSDYCIYRQSVSSPLRCWINTNENSVNIEFESNKKAVYSLVDTLNNKVVSVAEVEVGWVHKTTSRKRRWRLF